MAITQIQRTFYVTSNGNEFDSHEAAVEHEETLETVAMLISSGVYMYDVDMEALAAWINKNFRRRP